MGGATPRLSGLTTARARLVSGLVLFAFVLTHFLNHALGLVSFEAMQAVQDARTLVSRSLPGTVVLAAAIAVHFALGIAKFLKLRTWRIGLRDGVQLLFGLMIPVLLIRHVLGTRGAHEIYGVDDGYLYALRVMWPTEGLNQAVLMVLVWVHACIGLHHWLCGRRWYRRWIAAWYGLAVLVPALAYAGFVTAARASRLRDTFDVPFTSAEFAEFRQVFHVSGLAYYAILGGAVLVWLGLLVIDRFGRKVRVSYVDGPEVRIARGLTVLEASRIHRIPHASVCGGRARCSTCRVRVVEGMADLPPSSDTETAVLRRVGAPQNVRLACQLRPTAPLTISMLMPANVTAKAETAGDRYHWGVEQEVTLMFCDLRGFTKMSEGRLPFDVVFLLNQFLGRMAEAITDSGGFVDKFMGDGIMAIFGIDGPRDEGARQAITAARAMGGVLSALNQSLQDELRMPLQMGIGLHSGPAILGRIGAAQRSSAQVQLTALGETVNIASRLEGLTKDLGVQVIVSAACMATSGLAPGAAVARQAVEVRGLSLPLDVFTALRAIDLPVRG